ncbi:MAG: hypothetical protein AAF206_23645 [Bacteroidota bacterium]
MKTEDHIFEQIDAYLDGALAAEEHQLVKERLQSDPEWQAVHEKVVAARTSVKAFMLTDLADELRRDYENGAAAQPDVSNATSVNETEKAVAVSRPLYQRPAFILSVAAVVSLLFLIIWWNTDKQNPLSPQEIYADHAEAIVPVPTELLTQLGTGMSDTLAQAEHHYAQGDFRNALALFQLTDTASAKPRIQLFIASSYLLLAEFEEAEAVLSTITNDYQWGTDARKLLAMCYLGQDRAAEALNILQSLHEQGELKSSQEKDLYQALQRSLSAAGS